MMVATITSYDVDLFNNAHDNICLIADKVWAYNQEDSYRKLNRTLWVKIAKLKENHQKSNKKLVSDVIPKSRLSKYGNYVYDDERESLYISTSSINRELPVNTESAEPWQHPDVKVHFTRLTNAPENLRVQALPASEPVDLGCEEYDRYQRPPYTVAGGAELELKLRISSDTVRDLWRCSTQLNDGEYRYYGNRDQHRRITNEIQAVAGGRYEECKCTKTVPILSAEVPEFFPKGPRLAAQYESVPLQYFPTDRIYNRAPLPNVGAVFQSPGIPLLTGPMVNPLIRSPHWLPRIGPPLQIQVPVCTLAPQTFTSIQSICPIIHRPIQLHEKIVQPSHVNPSPIPVYQRPPEHYGDYRRKNHGVDFNNLILLTKNGVRGRRGKSGNLKMESEQNLKTDNDVLQWLNVSQPGELITSNSIVSDLRNLESKLDAGEICESAEHDNDDEPSMNALR